MTTTTTSYRPRYALADPPVPTGDLSTALSTAIPFRRLVRVELRKLYDTRAGVALLVIVGAVTVLVMGLAFALGDPADLTYFAFVSATAVPQGILLPVLGILAVTGEWTQRTTMTTFVLEPRRARVATAKLGATIALSLLAVAAALTIGAVVHLAAIAFRGAPGEWSLDPAVVGGAVLVQLIAVTMGVAFGLAIQQSTLAIVGYLLLPTGWLFVSSLVSGLGTAAGWLDLTRTETPLLAGEMVGGDWLRLIVSVLVWVGVPLALGYRRWTRREVS